MQLIDSAQELEIYFLFEHKSYPDKFARLQILNYMIQKWLDLKKNHKVNHSLPIIIPVVIYHGTANWKFGLDFADYFDLPTEEFRKYIPKFEHILHDITHMGDEAFKTSIIMEIFHLLLKYIHYPEMDEKIQEIYDLLNKLPEDDKRKEYLKIIVRYVLRVGPISVERVAEHTKRFSGGEEMTGVAFEQIRKEVEQEFLQKKDQWVSEAKSEGKVENAQEMLIELLEEELDIPSQAMLDNIRSINSYEILRGLFKKARKVNSLEEFSQELDRVLKS